jgi:hypothetical protein
MELALVKARGKHVLCNDEDEGEKYQSAEQSRI